MRNIKDSRFIVRYSESEKEVKFSKQFNSKFHLDNYITKMKSSGYKDIEVIEKKDPVDMHEIYFEQRGKLKKITKEFKSVKARRAYLEALKRNGCKKITCKVKENVVSYNSKESMKFIPAKEFEQTYYFTRTNRKSKF